VLAFVPVSKKAQPDGTVELVPTFANVSKFSVTGVPSVVMEMLTAQATDPVQTAVQTKTLGKIILSNHMAPSFTK
jgi:hypothetical protein